VTAELDGWMAGGDRLGTERGDTARRKIDARQRRGIRIHTHAIGAREPPKRNHPSGTTTAAPED